MPLLLHDEHDILEAPIAPLVPDPAAHDARAGERAGRDVHGDDDGGFEPGEVDAGDAEAEGGAVEEVFEREGQGVFPFFGGADAEGGEGEGRAVGVGAGLGGQVGGEGVVRGRSGRTRRLVSVCSEFLPGALLCCQTFGDRVCLTGGGPCMDVLPLGFPQSGWSWPGLGERYRGYRRNKSTRLHWNERTMQAGRTVQTRYCRLWFGNRWTRRESGLCAIHRRSFTQNMS